MQPSISKLKKFFSLEAEREYDNGAVMGGLEKMLGGWESEARADNLDEALVTVISARLRDYGKLSPDGREEALKGLWNRIRREIKIAGEEPGSAKPKSKAKSPAKAPSPAPQAAAKTPAPKAGTKAKNSKERVTRPTLPKREIPDGPAAALDANVTVLDGVGPTNTERLEKLGIKTLRHMLYHFPRRYDDYSQLLTIRQLKYGQEVTVIGQVKSSAVRRVRGKSQLSEVVIDDETGAIRATWFNQPWVAKNIGEGDQIVLSGKVDQYLGRLVMNSPEWEPIEAEHLHTKRIVPVYRLTADIGQRWLRGMMNKVVQYWAPRVEDPLPAEVQEAAEVIPLGESLLQVHFPDSEELLQAARYRLAFDELFVLQLAVLQQKQLWQGQEARAFAPPADWLAGQLARLPYQLTKAQQSALDELLGDLGSGRPMNRLLQGDVGSGKTVVAALAMAAVAQDSAQAAIMAPTSILAEQHYASLSELLAGEGGPLQPDEIKLMVGATKANEKKEIRAGLKSGAVKLVVGTHTLIEDPVVFSELELIVIDEQHRFGVEQRAALRDKGNNPHVLVMTATPIPRSLALTLYGDLDLSIIDEMPPGRQPVSTHILFPRERERGYNLIRKQAEEGRQAYIIYPLVEGEAENEEKAAVQQHKRLAEEVFPNYTLTLLHGRMGADDKEANMAKFRDGEAQILVSTTVIEVGVDGPQATAMMIEGANRFGLAQLHQLRGRVGRGADKSYCLLIPEHDEAAENERLQAMVNSNDGFELAETDLQQRGPGQFLGTQQSGFHDLRLASLTDARMIVKARQVAEGLLGRDPDLGQPEHARLAGALQAYWQHAKGDLS
jgi:ATP-dependent DNA helicase RecG